METSVDLANQIADNFSFYFSDNQWYTKNVKDIQNPLPESCNLDSNGYSNLRFLRLPLEQGVESVAQEPEVTLKLAKNPTLENYDDQIQIVVKISFRLFSNTNKGLIMAKARLAGFEHVLTSTTSSQWQETLSANQKVTVAEWKKLIQKSSGLELSFLYTPEIPKPLNPKDDEPEVPAVATPGTPIIVQLAVSSLQFNIDGISEPVNLKMTFENCKEYFDLSASRKDLDKRVSLNNQFGELWSNPRLPNLPSKIPAWQQRPEEPAQLPDEQPAENPHESLSTDEFSKESNKESSQSVYQHPEEVSEYFYTDKGDRVLQVKWKQEVDLASNEDLCFSFAYFSSSRTESKVSISLPDPNFELLADQDKKGKKKAANWVVRPAIIDKRVVAVLQPTVGRPLSTNQHPFEWHLVEFCARRDAQPSLLESHLISGQYVLQVESVIFEEELKTNLVAVTEFHVQTRRVHASSPRNLLADWDSDGKVAYRQWHVQSETEHFRIQWRQNNGAKPNLQLAFNRPRYPHATGYALISDWLWLNDKEKVPVESSNTNNDWMNLFSNEKHSPIERSASENAAGVPSSKKTTDFFAEDSLVDKKSSKDLRFNFKINRCVQNALLTIFVQNGQLTKYPLNEVKLDCASASDQIEQKISMTINDEIRRKLDSPIARVFVDLQLLEPNEEQYQAFREESYVSQSLKIEDFKLLNPCNQHPNPCHGGSQTSNANTYGTCIPTSRTRFRCECDANRHGLFCQFWNYCVKASEQHAAQSGDQVCKNAATAGCKTLGNNFYCSCPVGQIWNSAGSRCESAPACTFARCGLNENCVEDQRKANGFKCRCVPGYRFDKRAKRCVKDVCKNACGFGQLCQEIPGSDKPFCYCLPGFRLKEMPAPTNNDSNFQQLSTGCEPIAVKSPLIRQWLLCEHGYDANGQCECAAGYHPTTINPRLCEIDDDWKDRCSNCKSNQICKRDWANENDIYSCECIDGLTGNDCDQDAYCSVEANAKETAELCGGEETGGCEFDIEGKNFTCKSCPVSYSLNSQTGRCELRQDLCQVNSCAAQGAICQLQFDPQDAQLKAVCECPPGRVRSSPEQGAQCIGACSLLDCSEMGGECVYDLVKEKSHCQCQSGYALNSNTKKCELFADALHIRGVLHVQLIDETSLTRSLGVLSRAEKQQILLLSSRVHPRLDCSKSLDVPSCLKLTKQLNAEIIGANHPESANYFRTEVEKTLNKVLEQMDNDWALASGLPVPDLISQARVVDVRPYNHLSRKKDFNFEFGFENDYEVHLALSVTGAELHEREKQWKRNCVRIPTQSAETEQATNPTVQPPSAAGTGTRISDPQRCIIADRLSWMPRQTLMGWLNLCRTNAHHCDRYSQCQGGRGEYQCECVDGFQSVYQILRKGIKQQLCMDIDECQSSNLNQCTKNTECENTLGSYRCNCRVNFKRQDAFTCEGKFIYFH